MDQHKYIYVLKDAGKLICIISLLVESTYILICQGFNVEKVLWSWHLQSLLHLEVHALFPHLPAVAPEHLAEHIMDGRHETSPSSSPRPAP